MKLTRLRRFLRQNSHLSFSDAQKMLDMIDIIGEDAENYEYWMQQEDITPKEDEMKKFVIINVKRSLELFTGIELVGMQGIIDSLATEVGYERVLEALQNWKKDNDERIRLDKEFEELDDHPF